VAVPHKDTPTKGNRHKRKAQSPALRLFRARIADGVPQQIRDKGQQHLFEDEAWLIGDQERRNTISPSDPEKS
jgi:hypothetical protein